MTGASIKVELDAVKATAALDRIERGASNSTALFTEIGSALEASTRERIATTKTAPDGTPWVDLKPRTVARKQERGHMPGILTARGDLLNSIAFEAGDSFVDIIAGPTEYAAIHQFGGAEGMPPGPAAIPARPFLGVSEQDQAEIDEAVGDWLQGLANG